MGESNLPPLRQAREIIGSAIAEGTRAQILTRITKSGRRSTLEVAFADLDWNKSPHVCLSPLGLTRYRFTTAFGAFAGSTIRQMNAADPESKSLANALFQLAENEASEVTARLDVTNSSVDASTSFSGTIGRSSADLEERMLKIAHDIIAPLMSAFAELNGYDLVQLDDLQDESNLEGAISIATIKRRERNPRNRMLALRIHGSSCKACDRNLAREYDLAKEVIDIHHIQPLASNEVPTAYDPARDLVPLCPNCHRIAHTNGSIPFSIPELIRIVGGAQLSKANE